MTIAIIVAMDKELQLLLPLLSEPRTTVIDGITFYLGDTGTHSLIIMKSGIGKVNAALATMQLIRQFAPDLVINTGVAGGTGFFESDRNVTSLSVLHDNPRVRHGLIASGDVFVADPEVVAHIKALYPDVLAVDMESAAIAHTCFLLNTPFFCIRVVSDTPGEADNEAQYNDFWEAAPRQSFEIISSILNSIE